MAARRSSGEKTELVKKVAQKVNCPVVGVDLTGQISNGPWRGQVYGGQSIAYDPQTDKSIVAKDRDRDVLVFSF